MKVLILAAGYATRLHPLTLNTPKPLLPIGGKAIIDRIIDNVLAIKEIDFIYVVTNAKFFPHFKEWLKTAPCGDKATIINDGTTTNENRYGAIKDIEITVAEERIDDDLLVIAGDNLFGFNMQDFSLFAREKSDGSTVALYDIGSRDAATRYGVVSVDEHLRVIDFEEKPSQPKTTLVSTGVYYFPKEKLSFLKEYVKIQDKKLDAPGYYVSWLSKKDTVYGFIFQEEWYDIGDMESYKEADRKHTTKE